MTESHDKHEAIEQFVEGFAQSKTPLTEHYLAAYVDCFNRQDFYMAHDVLELHWLDERKISSHADLYKGIIQLAAAFLHLKLNYLHPTHHAHGRRLAPAIRLLKRSQELMHEELVQYADFDLREMIDLSRKTLLKLESHNPTINHWTPEQSPKLHVPVKIVRIS
jgi:predicted metal-dependent hydrolase